MRSAATLLLLTFALTACSDKSNSDTLSEASKGDDANSAEPGDAQADGSSDDGSSTSGSSDDGSSGGGNADDGEQGAGSAGAGTAADAVSATRADIAGCEDPAPGSSPIRRLTNAEYRNTLVDLLGDEELVERVSRDLPREPTSLGFRTNAGALSITPLIADVYTQSAQDLGRAVAANAELVGCEPQQADAACVQAFVESFGQRAYRRPLSNTELRRYADLYDAVITETNDPASALSWIAASMFSSPHFLFRVELSSAPNGGVSRPTGYEMATRLSYLLWQTMPDEQLFDAAEAGDLVTRDGIETQVRRMMEDAKALRVYEFFEQWLDLDEAAEVTRSDETYPEYSDELRQLLQAENRAFIYHLLTTGGTFSDMLAAEYTFANKALAEHYALSDVPDSNAFEKVEAPGRAGVLTQAPLLIHDRPLRSSIVKRGLKIRTDFFCQIVPAPPADVDTTLPSLDGQLTQRDRLQQHRADPSCAGCHALMDPIGEIFEPFDALGRAREQDEAGAAITVGGSITGTATLDGDYADARQLASAMATSDEVRQCFALQAFRFFYGRDATTADECSQAQLLESFARSDYRLVDLLIGLTRSDQFLYRKPSTDESGGGQ